MTMSLSRHVDTWSLVEDGSTLGQVEGVTALSDEFAGKVVDDLEIVKPSLKSD